MNTIQRNTRGWFLLTLMVCFGMATASTCDGQAAVPYSPPAWATSVHIGAAPGPTAASVLVKIDLPTPCHSVISWGQVVQSGNVFHVDAQFGSGSAFCPQVITPVQTSYTLGALAPGNYQFVFLAWGMVVKSQAFSVLPPERHTPAPAQTTITATTVRDATVVSVNVDLPSGCEAVSSWGQATRIGNRIQVDTQFVSRAGVCAQAIVPVATSYNLGALPPGDYHFVFKAWGTEVKTMAFSTMPQLAIMPLGGSMVRVSWSDIAAGWILEQSSTLQPTDWSPAAGVPVVTSGQAAVDINVNGASRRFFRLKMP